VISLYYHHYSLIDPSSTRSSILLPLRAGYHPEGLQKKNNQKKEIKREGLLTPHGGPLLIQARREILGFISKKMKS